MIALFGIQSNATMELDTVLLPNYKAGWEHFEGLQEAWRKNREDFGDFPRATAARRAPHLRPSRELPKLAVLRLRVVLLVLDGLHLLPQLGELLVSTGERVQQRLIGR